MRLSAAYIAKLGLEEAARETVQTPSLQMPHLISERALVNGTKVLAEQAAALCEFGYRPSMEVIAMPKHGYGPRPIGILSPETRTLYRAIVGRLESSLPPSSRDGGMDVHRNFGVEAGRPPGERIVDLDIAACYEYIDHAILA